MGYINLQYPFNPEILSIYDYDNTGQSWAVIWEYRKRKKEGTYALISAVLFPICIVDLPEMVIWQFILLGLTKKIFPRYAK